MTTERPTFEAVFADPKAVCTFVNHAIFTAPRTPVGDVLEAVIRGCMKAEGWPGLIDYSEAVAFLFNRFDACIETSKDSSSVDQAMEYLMAAPRPVRQMIHNAAIEIMHGDKK